MVGLCLLSARAEWRSSQSSSEFSCGEVLDPLGPGQQSAKVSRVPRSAESQGKVMPIG